ncbi:hypothetical protein VNO77_01381 [Canavalia gladiata]|uniref:Uncharacterized protein n=1 Tax=Canavalia gladiata TaxID=3824 RepID=A0AAN9R573_CANGL
MSLNSCLSTSEIHLSDLELQMNTIYCLLQFFLGKLPRILCLKQSSFEEFDIFENADDLHCRTVGCSNSCVDCVDVLS